MSLLFNMLSRMFRAFLPGSKCFLISWLQSSSSVILEPKKIKPCPVSISSPSTCHEGMGLNAMILVFWMLSFKITFYSIPSLSSRGFYLFFNLFNGTVLSTEAWLHQCIRTGRGETLETNIPSPTFWVLLLIFTVRVSGQYWLSSVSHMFLICWK